jgi:anthranilate phosphoribosyltransferase
VKTIFNILGPLTNPAGARQHLIGVFHPDLVGIEVRVLQRLGSRGAVVVHGMDGIDEISISGPSMLAELKGGEIREYSVTPQDFGLPVHAVEAIQVEGVEQSKAMVLAALSNEPGAARDIVALNAGAGIYAAGLASTVADGVKKAQTIIASGAARKKLDQFVAFTRGV